MREKLQRVIPIPLDQGRARSKKQIITVNFPVFLIDLISNLVNCGVFQSRSEICRLAVQEYVKRFFNEYGGIILTHLTPTEDMEVEEIRDLTDLQAMVREALGVSKEKQEKLNSLKQREWRGV